MTPLAVKQIKGKPFIVSESSWVPPNIYQAEGPLMVAAYSALTGMDAYYWFNLISVRYDDMIYKWQAANPSVMAGWPAAAWIFHNDLVRRGEVVVDEKRALAGDLWELACPVIAEDDSYDPNQPGTRTAQNNIEGGAPYGAFFIGPAQVEYNADPELTTINLFGQDPEDLAVGRIRSNTGELFLNAPEGYFLLDAPMAQGVTGFLREAGPLETSAMIFECNNDYAAIIAASLDGLPLTESSRVFLQFTTKSRPLGWQEEPVILGEGSANEREGFRILDTGAFPWSVEKTDATVRIRNAGLAKATLADVNFYPVEEIPVVRDGEWLVVTLPENAMYVVLE
jgi:hypothetical protein